MKICFQNFKSDFLPSYFCIIVKLEKIRPKNPSRLNFLNLCFIVVSQKFQKHEPKWVQEDVKNSVFA